MKVRQLMTQRPVTIPRDARCARAELEMKLAAVRHLPVVDADGHLVGIVSASDLPSGSAKSTLEVGDLMHDVVYTVGPDSDAAEAAAMLIDRKIGSLPVIDEQRHLLGIVTETDFLNIAFQALRGLPLHARGAPS